MTASVSEMNWEIGEVVTNAKGVKSAQILDRRGSLIVQNLATPREPLSTPFGASAFNDPTATRKNICFRLNPILTERISKIDKFMSGYIAKHSNRLFKGRQLTYKPILVPGKEEYSPLIRCKINTTGLKACRCWDGSERCEMPEDLRDYSLVPRVHFRSLWIMGDSCGVTVDVIDMRVSRVADECPFSEEE